jgi:hypothetical protein
VRVGEARQNVKCRAGDEPVALVREAAAEKASRANRWCSASTSTVVKTPSACIPRISQTPEAPVPVPISTIALASSNEARKRSIAPPPGPIGLTPTSAACARAEARTSSSR